MWVIYNVKLQRKNVFVNLQFFKFKVYCIFTIYIKLRLTILQKRAKKILILHMTKIAKVGLVSDVNANFYRYISEYLSLCSILSLSRNYMMGKWTFFPALVFCSLRSIWVTDLHAIIKLLLRWQALCFTLQYESFSFYNYKGKTIRLKYSLWNQESL